ncbi:MAG: cofactor assembly of complex C subunit B, partial [Microcystaceae cyanobacterium]
MDSTPVLASTLLFTILSFIGLFFFIKASVKERTAFVQCPIAPDQSDRL